MERLTYDFCIGGNHCWQVKGADNFLCKDVCADQGDNGCEMCPIKKAFDRLAAYEDTGMEPKEVKEFFEDVESRFVLWINKRYGIPAMEFMDIMQGEKDGRLVVLPCKVGDVVYESNKRGFISTYKVISIRISYCSVLIGWELIDGIYSNLNGFEVSELGKTVFLTRAEAEAALERRKEEK